MADRDFYLEEFNHWADLASSDPAAFETMRQKLIEEFIGQAPVERQQRLRSLQWRIDQERARAKSPLGACIRLSRMMWDRMLGKGGLVDQLQQLRASLERGTEPSAKPPVLQFRPRSR
jgi:hypothetical protein